jgi:hypothetical protein
MKLKNRKLYLCAKTCQKVHADQWRPVKQNCDQLLIVSPVTDFNGNGNARFNIIVLSHTVLLAVAEHYSATRLVTVDVHFIT